MELLKLISKEAIVNEKLPLDISTEDGLFEYGEIEKFLARSNFGIGQLSEAFELNRDGKLADYLFERNSKKVIAYQKIGLRFVSEVLFGYKEYKRVNRKIEPALELPPPAPMTIEESYKTLKAFIIEKYKKGEQDYFKLATYLLDEFYELERANIEIDLAEQKELFNEAERWLKSQQESVMTKQGYSDIDIHRAKIDKRGAHSLAKRHVLAKMIIEDYLMEQTEIEQ